MANPEMTQAEKDILAAELAKEHRKENQDNRRFQSKRFGISFLLMVIFTAFYTMNVWSFRPLWWALAVGSMVAVIFYTPRHLYRGTPESPLIRLIVFILLVVAYIYIMHPGYLFYKVKTSDTQVQSSNAIANSESTSIVHNTISSLSDAVNAIQQKDKIQDQQLSDLTQRVTNVETRLDTLQKSVLDLSDEHKSMNARITTAEAAIKDVESLIATLETSDQAQNQEIIQLKAWVEQFKAQLAALSQFMTNSDQLAKEYGVSKADLDEAARNYYLPSSREHAEANSDKTNTGEPITLFSTKAGIKTPQDLFDNLAKSGSSFTKKYWAAFSLVTKMSESYFKDAIAKGNYKIVTLEVGPNSKIKSIVNTWYDKNDGKQIKSYIDHKSRTFEALAIPDKNGNWYAVIIMDCGNIITVPDYPNKNPVEIDKIPPVKPPKPEVTKPTPSTTTPSTTTPSTTTPSTTTPSTTTPSTTTPSTTTPSTTTPSTTTPVDKFEGETRTTPNPADTKNNQPGGPDNPTGITPEPNEPKTSPTTAPAKTAPSKTTTPSTTTPKTTIDHDGNGNGTPDPETRGEQTPPPNEGGDNDGTIPDPDASIEDSQKTATVGIIFSLGLFVSLAGGIVLLKDKEDSKDEEEL